MTIEGDESFFWFNGTSARENDLPHAERAAAFIGNLVVNVIDDPSQARRIFQALKEAELRNKYRDAPDETVAQIATEEAERFVANMQPSESNGQNPARLIRIESTDGSNVSQAEVYEAARFRIAPGGQVVYHIQ